MNTDLSALWAEGSCALCKELDFEAILVLEHPVFGLLLLGFFLLLFLLLLALLLLVIFPLLVVPTLFSSIRPCLCDLKQYLFVKVVVNKGLLVDLFEALLPLEQLFEFHHSPL